MCFNLGRSQHASAVNKNHPAEVKFKNSGPSERANICVKLTFWTVLNAKAQEHEKLRVRLQDADTSREAQPSRRVHEEQEDAAPKSDHQRFIH
jgi:hypothetical protein